MRNVFIFTFFLSLIFLRCSTKKSTAPISEVVSAQPFNSIYQEKAIDNITVKGNLFLKYEDFHFVDSVSYIARVNSIGDNHFILSEGDKKSNKNVSDYYLSKIDKKGKLVWKKSYDNEYMEQFGSDMLNKDGNLYILSSTFGTNRAHNDFNLASINTKGKLLWSQIIDLPDYQPAVGLYINNDEIYCIGRNVSQSIEKINVQLCKFSLDGANYLCNDNKENFDGLGYSIAELNDSTMILLARQESSSERWMSIIGVDKNLNFKWNKKIANVTGGNTKGEMLFDSKGYIYVQSSVAVDGFGSQILISKLNRAGDLMWNKSYGFIGLAGGSMMRVDKPLFIEPSTKGGVISGGSTGSLYGSGINYVFEIDQHGETKWCLSFMNPHGYLTDINKYSDGYIVSGYYRESLASSEISRGFVFKIDFDGNLVAF